MTSAVKSPFHIIEDFISPGQCEWLIEQLGIKTPSVDERGVPLKHERLLSSDAELSNFIKAPLVEHIPAIQDRYLGEVVGLEAPLFQQYFENPNRACEQHGCANAKYARKKWIKHRDIDLIGYLWLKDFQGGVPLDPRFEVYGGKLEFPAYDFSLVPQRGTLVIFPAGPHFITAISPILVGSLEQVQVPIKLEDQGGSWYYQPVNHPGTYQEWFTQET